MSRHLVSLTLLLCAMSAHADEPETLDSVMQRLKGRTDEALSPEALQPSSAYTDSVRSAFAQAVADHGLDGFIDQEGERRSAFRTGLNLDPQHADFRYSNVDGFTLLAPVSWHAIGHKLRAEFGGNVGYAFASKSLRYDAGVRLKVRGWRARVHWSELAQRYGFTELVGGGWYALFGNDEHRYYHREGWTTSLSRDIGDSRLTVGYDRYDERSMAARDPFHVGGTSALHRVNPPITDGVRRVTWVEFAPHVGPVEGLIRGERSTGLRYERLLGHLAWRPHLPHDDRLALSVRGQVAASETSVPIQALAAPVGHNGVRGVPQGTRVGTHALFGRAELLPARDWLALARIPYADRVRLELIPFVDVGAAWSPDARTLAGGTTPDADDWVWGAGLGIRRATGFGPILSHLRLDLAWRLDRDVTRPVAYFVMEVEPF